MIRRAALPLAAIGLLAGCANAPYEPVDCVPASCLVTFDRGAPPAPIEVRGVHAQLVGVRGKVVPPRWTGSG